jgi:rare lipoprotein A
LGRGVSSLHHLRKTVGAIARGGAVAALGAALAGCATDIDPKYGVRSSTRVVAPGQPVPKGGGKYRVGDPYIIAGRAYTPREDSNYRAEGHASWYGPDFHGRLTANGEVYDMHGISAAHPTLPLPCYVRVTNLENRRSLVVRVNDRGPFHQNRVIDLSARAAKLLGFYDKGLARVRVEYVSRASLNGSDDNKLAASLRTDEPVAPLVRVAAATPAPSHAIQAPAFAPTDAPVRAQTSMQSAALVGRGLY